MVFEWLAAAAGLFLLLVAWLIHLREDGLLGRRTRPSGRTKRVLLAAGIAALGLSLAVRLFR